MEIPRPTKEFFESDPIAADIRNLTLDGLAGCLHRLLGRDGWDGKIMEAAAGLQERGVTAGMHLIQSNDPEVIQREQQEMMASPRRAAEFVAGMFLGYLYEFEGALEMPPPGTPEARIANIDMDSLSRMELMLDRRPEEFRDSP